MREWTKSFVFRNTTATTYSQFTEVLTNGLLSTNISIVQCTSEITGDSDSSAGQHKVPLGSLGCHLKVKLRNRMGQSLIHRAAKLQSLLKVFRYLSYTRICRRDPHMPMTTC
jgi:hypothetical protein